MRKRSFLASGIGLTLLVIVLFYLFSTLQMLRAGFTVVEDAQNDLAIFFSLNLKNITLAETVKSFIISGDSRWERLYDETLLEMEELLVELKQIEKHEDELTLLDQFERRTNQLRGTELLIIAKVKSDDRSSAQRLFDERYENAQNETGRILDQLTAEDSEKMLQAVAESQSIIVQAQRRLFQTGSFFVIFALIASFVTTNYSIRPLKDLAKTATTFGQGNLKVRAQVYSDDELGQVARSFNKMADELSQSYQNLEQKVAARTAELQKTTSELERINKLMVGRELKMIELKKEIEVLKSKSL